MTRNPKANVYASAIAEPTLYVPVALGAAMALAVGAWLPFVLAGVFFIGYMLFFADSDRYRRILLNREDKAEQQKTDSEKDAVRRKILNSLDRDQMNQYNRLSAMRDSVKNDAPTDDMFYSDIVVKLTDLLDKFLIFADREAKYRKHLESVRDELREQHDSRTIKTKSRVQPTGDDHIRQLSPQDDLERWAQETISEIASRYDDDVAAAEADIAQRQPNDVNIGIIRKRIEIIKRRSQFVQRIGMTMVSLNHQMRLLDDTFGLIADETKARPPQEMLSDIDEVVLQTNSMTETLDAIDGSFFQDQPSYLQQKA
jgi:hypothetical protein